jgi:hypothetical protein
MVAQRNARLGSDYTTPDFTQLPDAGGRAAGVRLDDLKRLLAYWWDACDWREVERLLNRLPNFSTEIDGERIHFVHAATSPLWRNQS